MRTEETQRDDTIPEVFTPAQEKRLRQIIQEEIHNAKVADAEAGFEDDCCSS